MNHCTTFDSSGLEPFESLSVITNYVASIVNFQLGSEDQEDGYTGSLRPDQVLGNSLTQTNQTKQKFIRWYYLGCLIRKVQFEEQNKSSTKHTMFKYVCLICLVLGIS